MLVEAVRLAEQAIALSYPSDRWFVRAAIWIENARRARKTDFRTFVHPPPSIQEFIEQSGFELAATFDDDVDGRYLYDVAELFSIG